MGALWWAQTARLVARVRFGPRFPLLKSRVFSYLSPRRPTDCNIPLKGDITHTPSQVVVAGSASRRLAELATERSSSSSESDEECEEELREYYAACEEDSREGGHDAQHAQVLSDDLHEELRRERRARSASSLTGIHDLENSTRV